MEDNSAAVECLILFYINTKHVLKTKQLDERVFLDQMVRHTKQNGYNAYDNEEIRNTWKTITQKYVELKKTGTAEERESWKYYEILDSCYEQSDFHNGVYPKFSEEMVWFLIECFLKRRGLEKTHKKNSILNDVHKEFLQSGYLYITRQDIENKWKYLNFKYDKLKEDPEALSKLPYLLALRGVRDKDDAPPTKMIFTRELTEILIERFTEKKITCVIHGYDSEQVLCEIQSEFRDLGFQFSQEEIKETWRKLTIIYSFLKAKGKNDSPWIYFNAMKEHFKDDFLFGFGQLEREPREDKQEKHKSLRQRSKSVGPDVRRKYVSVIEEPKLIVSIEQLDKSKMSPKKTNEEQKSRAPKRKASIRKLFQEDTNDSCKPQKKSRARSKSREKKPNKNKSAEVKPDNPVAEEPTSNTISVRADKLLRKLSIDQNGNQERRNSTDLGSPGSKVHIINIDESEIDKKSGNLTINLPSITKKFSDNEFLPLKKRLRLGDDSKEKHTEDSKNIKDGFLGFPRSESSPDSTGLTKPNENENKRLTEEEMSEIMKRITQDKPDSFAKTTSTLAENPTDYKPNNFDYNLRTPYSTFDRSCLLVPKEEQQDTSPQNYNPNDIAPPPVLLLVIKVDGSNNPVKENASDEKKQPDKSSGELCETPEPERPRNKLNFPEKSNTCSVNVVKPISPKDKICTVTKSENLVSVQTRNCNGDINNITDIKSDLNTVEIKDKVIKIAKPEAKDCTVTLKENVPLKNHKKEEGQKADTSVISSDSVYVNSSDSVYVNEVSETVPIAITETVIPPAPSDANDSKKIRLPVKGGGKVKEIFISSRELKKLAKIKPGDFKPTTSPTKIVQNNTSPVKINPDSTMAPPKFKFISQVIKPAKVVPPTESKMEKPQVKAGPPADTNFLAPPLVALVGHRFLGTNNSKTPKNEEFENESVFSEAVGEDDCLKDNLLATVIDFQEQNNQEFVEIKNLMKQNNLLQRETNRLLRLMLEKM